MERPAFTALYLPWEDTTEQEVARLRAQRASMPEPCHTAACTCVVTGYKDGRKVQDAWRRTLVRDAESGAQFFAWVHCQTGWAFL